MLKILVKHFLVGMNGFKFLKTLKIIFYRKTEDETKYVTVHFSSKTKIVINGLNIDDGCTVALLSNKFCQKL